MPTAIQQIPAGWKMVQISDICKILSGSTPKTSESEYWDGSIPWFTPLDLSEIRSRYVKASDRKITEEGFNSCSAQKIPPHSLIMSSRAPIGYFAINLEEATTNQGCKSFACSEVINVDFLYYYLNQNINQIKRLGSGSTFAEVNKKQLESLQVIIPFKSEQTRIAAILSKVDEEIEKVERIIEQTEKLKKGLMQRLLTKGIGHTKFKQTELGEIPEEWEVVKLENICDFTTGKLNSNKAVLNGKYAFFTCSQETFAIDSYSFDQEAILLAGNNAAGIYSVKYYNGKFDAYQRTYVITTQSRENLDYIFLKEILQTKLEELKNASLGSTTKFLTVKLLKNLQIKLPSLKEQRKLSEIFSALNSNISINQKMKSQLLKLKKGLMNDLLSGKVKVKGQDCKSIFHEWLLNFPDRVKNTERSAIMKLLEAVKQASQQEYDEIFEGVDFNQNDKRIEKLEAILAEWRSVIFLKNHQFVDIKLLSSNEKVKDPDILANFNNYSFAIEVKCLTREHSRNKMTGIDIYSINDAKLENTLETIAESAKTQLDSKESNYKMLIFALNRAPDAELHTDQENKAIINALAHSLNWGEKYYFGFVSRSGLEDFVLPSLNLRVIV